MMFLNVISLKLVVGTYIGKATPVYNGKNTLGVPLRLSFYTIPPFIKYGLVSDRTNFAPPSQNTQQLFDSYCILIT